MILLGAALAKRRIAIITGTRAEYGLLQSTMNALGARDDVDIQLIVTGMHLLKQYGNTVKEIEADGVAIAAEVSVMSENAGDPKAMALVVAKSIEEMTATFEKLDPEVVVVLGDRVEIFGSGVAAALTGRVLAHIHGGDVTRGGYDESMRHALSKFAHLHFSATEAAKERVIKLGEDPENVYFVGAPGVDLLLSEEGYSKEDLEKTYGVSAGDYVLLLQHSVSTAAGKAPQQIDDTLQALSKLGKPVIALYPNNDSGGEAIVAALDNATADNFHVFPNVRREEFLDLMKHAGVMCGNSSAAIIEAGYFGTPVVNIGERQEGREHGENVSHCGHDAETIEKLLRQCFEDEAHKKTCKDAKPPYGDGKAGEKIAEVLATHELRPELTHKKLAY